VQRLAGRMPLLTATSAFGLGRRRCNLHYLSTFKKPYNLSANAPSGKSEGRKPMGTPTNPGSLAIRPFIDWCVKSCTLLLSEISIFIPTINNISDV